jgi:hypothetical protein
MCDGDELTCLDMPPNIRVFNANRTERKQNEKQSLSHRGEEYILC